MYVIILLILFNNVLAGNVKTEREAVNTHNKYRIMHKAPKLAWSKPIEISAQKWADQCEFLHSSSNYGENLALGYNTIAAAINAWYKEVFKYNFSRPGYSVETGHFTQLVWKETTKLGCALGNCSKPLWVCQYSPAGNTLNYQKNVLKAK